MFQYHLKKNIHLSVIADWQSQNINIRIFKRKKKSVNLEQQSFLNWMFIKYYVFLSFGDDFERDTKAIHLKVKFKPTLFVPHINDVGKRERERESISFI